jgi:MoaA/NifB/PqqE/SkfB family radical SAM enzyme
MVSESNFPLVDQHDTQDAPDLSSQDSPDLSSQDNPDLSSQDSPDLSSQDNPDLSSQDGPCLSSQDAPNLSTQGGPDLSSQDFIPAHPTRLILELSRNCNIHCSMCGFGGHPIQDDWYMHKNILNQFLHTSPELSDFLSEVTEIRLNGRGESTIHPKFEEIVQTIASNFPHARLTLFTNLMVPNERILELFNQYNVEIYVSVDSADPNRFEMIRKGAKFELLISHLKRIRNAFLVFTLQKNNIDDIASIGKFAAEYNMGLIINIIRIDDPSYQAEFNSLLDAKWSILLEELGKLHLLIPQKRLLIPDQIWSRKIPSKISTTTSCGALPQCPNIPQEVMIGYDGIVYPCNMFNPEILGDLKSDSLPFIWQSSKHQSFLNNHKQHFYCNHCEYMIPRVL